MPEDAAAYEAQTAALSEMASIEMLVSDDEDPVTPRVLVGLVRKRATRRNTNAVPRTRQRSTLTRREAWNASITAYLARPAPVF